MLFVSASLALYRWYEHRKPRHKLAKRLPVNFSESLKGIDEGAFMRVIDASVTLVKE